MFFPYFLAWPLKSIYRSRMKSSQTQNDHLSKALFARVWARITCGPSGNLKTFGPKTTARLLTLMRFLLSWAMLWRNGKRWSNVSRCETGQSFMQRLEHKLQWWQQTIFWYRQNIYKKRYFFCTSKSLSKEHSSLILLEHRLLIFTSIMEDNVMNYSQTMTRSDSWRYRTSIFILK